MDNDQGISADKLAAKTNRYMMEYYRGEYEHYRTINAQLMDILLVIAHLDDPASRIANEGLRTVIEDMQNHLTGRS